MELDAARELAHQLMREHGLMQNEDGSRRCFVFYEDMATLTEPWTFKFNRGMRQKGLCYYQRRTIELSKHLVLLNDEESTRKTLLHEIAHALCGAKHGHNALWKRVCLRIGGTGERCYTGGVVLPPHKYEAICPVCKHIFKVYRRPKKIRSCGACCNAYNAERVLTYTALPHA